MLQPALSAMTAAIVSTGAIASPGAAPCPAAPPGPGAVPDRHWFGYALIAVWIQFLLPRAIVDPDIWWHLRDVTRQLNDRALLHRDVFSFTALRAPWINHEWLAEVPFWLGWHVAGARGVLFVTDAVIEIIFLGVYWLAHRACGSWPCATLATLVASLLATVSFGPRTLLFGWLCLVAELIVLALFAEKPRLALGLPPLFLVWVNLHGSWLIGMVVLAVYGLCGLWTVDRGQIHSLRIPVRHRQILGIATTLSFCALFINPYGWHLVAYPFDLAFHQTMNVSHVEEWRPLDLQSSRGIILLVSLMGLFAVQLFTPAKRQHPWTLSELAFLAIGTYSAFRHSRFLFLAAILAMPVFARHLAGRTRVRASVREPSPHAAPAAPVPRLLLNTVLLLATVLLCQLQVARAARQASPPGRHFPEAALPMLRTLHPRGPIFNDCLWGGYMIFNLPQIPVFIDSRFDIFERNGTLRDYLDIVELRNSIALLERHHVRYVLFEKDAPLVYLLQQTGHWQPLYEDGDTILLEHATADIPALTSPAAQ